MGWKCQNLMRLSCCISCIFLVCLWNSSLGVLGEQYGPLVEVRMHQPALEAPPPLTAAAAEAEASIVKGYSDIVGKEYGDIVETPSPAPLAPFLPCYTKLVVFSDGSVNAVDELSGKKCWSFSSGALLASPSHALLQVEKEFRDTSEGNASGGITGESEDRDHDSAIPNGSGALKHNIHKKLEDLLTQMPYFTHDGDLVIGSRSTTVFLLDSRTGSLVWSFQPDVESPETAGVSKGSAEPSLESKLGSLTGFKPIYISQINYTVSVFETSTANLKWSVNFVEIGTLDLGQGKTDHSQLSEDYLIFNLSSVFGSSKSMQKFGYRHLNQIAQFTPLAIFSSSEKLLGQLVMKHTQASSLEQQIGFMHEEPVRFLPPAEERQQMQPPKYFQLFEHLNGPIDERLTFYGDRSKALVSKLAPDSAIISVARSQEKKRTRKVGWWLALLLFGLVVGSYNRIRISLHRGGKENVRPAGNGKKRKGRKGPIGGVDFSSKQLQSAKVAVQTIKNSMEFKGGLEVEVSKNPKAEDNLDFVEGRKVGSLFVTTSVIGYGSHGTLVLEGSMEKRKVAVKRLLVQYYKKARKEIDALIDSDAHPNVVRYYAMERDTDFVFVALERCHFNLNDLILTLSPQVSCKSPGHEVGSFQLSQEAKNLEKEMDFKLWDQLNHPSPLLLKIMSDIVHGLEHLHSLGYVHRDLKPQNVLISKELTLCAKISDMGISKRLDDGATSMDPHATGVGSSGWQAPEQILHLRQTRAVDLFSLGCLLFFCITGGQHPFGSRLDRDGNIVLGKVDLFAIDHMPEATHLIASLLEKDAKKRSSALEVKNHPFFWSVEKRLSFLRDSSDRIELEDREDNSALLKDLEAAAPVASGRSWDEKLDGLLLENLGKYRRYNYQSVRDLLRVIRNKFNHYQELRSDVQELLGGIPEGYENYFRTRFPSLLLEVFKVLIKHCQREKMFKKYFAPSDSVKCE